MVTKEREIAVSNEQTTSTEAKAKKQKKRCAHCLVSKLRKLFSRKKEKVARAPISSERLITISLMVSISLCVSLFLFAVVVYAINELSTSRFVTAALTSNSPLKKENLETIRALSDYYKDASNFNIISLIYVLASSFLVSVLSFFFKKAKDDMSKQKKDIKAEIAKMMKQLEKVDVLTKYGNVIQLSYHATTHSSALFSLICAVPNDINAITAPNVTLRDIFQELLKLIPSNTIGWDALLKKELKGNLYQVKRLLEMCKGSSESCNWEGAYSEEMSVELLGFCDACINRLR